MKIPYVALALTALMTGCGAHGTGLLGQNALQNAQLQAAAASGGYTLISQPDGSAKTAIFSSIDNAKRSIDLTMYLMLDQGVVSHLAQASARGVAVRVLLERDPFYINTNVTHRPVPSPTPPAAIAGALSLAQPDADAAEAGDNTPPRQAYPSNQQAAADLVAQTAQARVPAKIFWADNSRFALTHEKSMVIDNQTALITSINFTSSGLGGNREYGVIDKNPGEVKEVESIFQADIQGTAYQVKQANLVVSPDDGSGQGNAKTKMMALIASATSTIQIEDEEFQDPDAAMLLGQMAAKGRRVEVILDPSAKVLGNAYLTPQKITPLFWAPHGGHMHAKLIVVDGQRAYLGSVNLSLQSMGYNREMGILLEAPPIMAAINKDFAADWAGAGGAKLARR